MYHYSATQIDIFADCKRKWFLRSVLGAQPEFENPYAELGKYIHGILERYLSGEKPPTGPDLAITIKGVEYSHDMIIDIILPAMRWLPKPGTVHVEERFEADLGELGMLIGYMDYRESFLVGDHKTTSNLKWAKTAEQLKTDTQAVIYAIVAMELSGSSGVVLRWGYIQTKGRPSGRLVEVTITAEEAATTWERILDRIRDMKAIRDSGCTKDEVAFNLSACEKYGGCAYKQACGLTSAQRMKGILKMSSLKDKMLARKQQQSGGLNPPPTTQETPPPTQPAPKAPRPPRPPKPTPVTPAPKPKSEPSTTAMVPIQIETSYTLYIDCIPDTPYTTLEELMNPALQSIVEEHGKHYRLLNLFGGNAALIASMVPDFEGDLVVSSSTNLYRDCQEVLLARAAKVVRGVL